MGWVCEMCGKRSLVGNRVSHANNKSKKRSYPNLQRVRVLHEGSRQHLRVCTRCIKKGRVVKVA